MTNEEQQAFVKAFSTNVGALDDDTVAAFVRRYNNGEEIEYSSDYSLIVDALLMWNEGIKWQMVKTNEALTLSLAELHRHATDTESGEKAISAVEGVLK